MNLPILQSEVKTMSSIDLLELINNVRVANNEEPLRRNSFNLKIEVELEGSHYTKNVVKNQNGTESVVYELTIEQCTLIGMRESKGVRRTVFEKLKQLENHIQLPNFTDPAEAAIAWANEYKAKQALAIENQTLKPKADAYEILSGAKGSVSIRVASGELKVPEKKFTQWLLDNDWVYRKGNRTDGKLLPHAHRKEQGYLELVNVVTYNTGEAVARSQTKVTQKGLARLAQIFSKNRALLTHKISSNEVTA